MTDLDQKLKILNKRAKSKKTEYIETKNEKNDSNKIVQISEKV